MSRKGCCLWWVLAGIALFFMFAWLSLPLEELGTVQHLGSDGTVKTNSVATLIMIFILCCFAVVVAVMLTRAEKKASDDVLLAPVAKHGCLTAFAWLSGLGVCGLLVWIVSMVGGI